MEDKRKNGDKNDLVLTPGGFRSRHLARRVEPGEIVRFDDKGQAEIKKKRKRKSSGPEGK